MYINDSVSQSLQAGFPLVCGGTEGIPPLPKKLTGLPYPTPQQFCPKNVDFVIIMLFFLPFYPNCHTTSWPHLGNPGKIAAILFWAEKVHSSKVVTNHKAHWLFPSNNNLFTSGSFYKIFSTNLFTKILYILKTLPLKRNCLYSQLKLR